MSVEPIVKQALQQGLLSSEQLSHLLHLAENEPLSMYELDLIDHFLEALRLGRLVIQRSTPQPPVSFLKETHSRVECSTGFSRLGQPMRIPLCF
ncbi:hypothetical protein L1047_05785 [Synechococcus sp. Nb3U1]|uniref:hypothetical protein n=1 Tax=Synechococcus sp. Nb3U1 TaxID=1914529 RepID=UPI001F196128|nr:hypothetical protein [Synechococcus sp. Nb3U1]MCF2970704.1 hypothetical protein [Synechococcus sp. Nb3U1]